MRILDEQDNELESYDEDAGYITEETIVVAHHDAVEAVDAVRKKVIDWQNPDDETNYQYHWEIETPAIAAQAAYDETETVQRYHPYTNEQLAERAQAKAAAEAAAAQAEAEAQAAAELQAALAEMPERMSDAEDGIIEVADMAASIEDTLNDIMDALIEIADSIEGEGE
jgi:glutamine synthetase type III